MRDTPSVDHSAEWPSRAGRLGDAVVWALLLIGSLLQQPGRTTFDTKFDLTADPGAFLGRALHLWNSISLGELQNQAYGYFFPQGPFFLATHLLSVPEWLAQRLWSALLLIAAYEGARRLCAALGMTGSAATLGGLCYALSPRLLGAVGVLSGEVLPEAVLPWVVLPLVLNRTGRLSARSAGLLSGIAVLFMSGVNATGTLAALPVAFLTAATGARSRRGAGLLGWWLVGVALACAWWLGPLLLLGRYSPPFLDVIETSAATTFPTDWANNLRGADHWLAFHTVNGQAWWPGAHLLMTTPFVAVVGMGITAFGLVGLVHPRMPLRGALTLSLVLGLVCLTVGNPSPVGSLVDQPVRVLLDGPLAVLRNVHKVDPLVRLPIALGFAHAAVLTVPRLRTAVQHRRPWLRVAAGRRVVVGCLVAVLLAAAPPLFLGALRSPGWTDVPQAWSQVARYLAARPDSRALVVPGAGFGLQTWGWTIDEPIQGVASTPWLTRSQVPMVPGPTARVLDALENRLADGQGSAGLAEYLALAGVTHVVLRRDVDPAVAETAASDRVQRALLDSPGLRLAAGFGRTGFGDQRLIDVYEVADPLPRAALAAATDVLSLDGGPEDILRALDVEALPPSQPVLVGSGPAPADLVTDGYRRVERQFGRSHDAVSEVMTATEAYRQGRPTHDYPGAATVRRVVAEYLGVIGVGASTAEGYPDVFGPVLPAHGPAAAFDGRSETWWQSAPLVPPAGQWLDVDLRRPLSGGVLRVSFLEARGTATVRSAAVSFDHGAATIYQVPAGGRLLAPIPTTPFHSVRISVVSVQPGLDAASPVAITEVQIPRVESGRTLDVPRSIGPRSTVLLGNEAPRRACVDIGYGPHCDASEIRSPDESGLDRQLHVAEAGSWNLSGTVVAQPDAAAAALLGPLDHRRAATVSSTSAYGGDPAVSALFGFDGQAQTPWLADPGDSQATMTLTWTGSRTVSRISVDQARVPAAPPVRARIESSAGVRDVDLTHFGFFEPLRARGRLTITFYKASSAADAALPLGIGDVHLEGLDGLQYRPSPDSRTGAVCGLGPEVRIDGTVHRTEVTGTVQDVVAGRPMTWRVCDGPVELAPGTHRVAAEPTVQYQPVALTWRPVEPSPTVSGSDANGRLRMLSWSDTRRVVSVTAGSASVLRIAENVNAGWRATLHGHRLEPVVVDGWQQGYRIPAGSAGDVVVEYTPDVWYRAALLAGLVLAVLLVVLAAISLRGFRRNPARMPQDLTTPTRTLGVLPALVVGAGGLVLGGVPLAVGWAAGLVPAVRRAAVALGTAALLTSGVLVAASPGLTIGRPGVWADATAAIGVGLLLAGIVRVRRPRLPGRPARGTSDD